LLVGTVVFLPVVLAYTAYSYYVFRGKADDKAHYWACNIGSYNGAASMALVCNFVVCRLDKCFAYKHTD